MLSLYHCMAQFSWHAVMLYTWSCTWPDQTHMQPPYYNINLLRQAACMCTLKLNAHTTHYWFNEYMRGTFYKINVILCSGSISMMAACMLRWNHPTLSSSQYLANMDKALEYGHILRSPGPIHVHSILIHRLTRAYYTYMYVHVAFHHLWRDHTHT